jgi:hypothetical protein
MLGTTLPPQPKDNPKSPNASVRAMMAFTLQLRK